VAEENGQSKITAHVSSRKDEIAGVDISTVAVEAKGIGSFLADFPEWPKQKEPLYVLNVMAESIMATIQLETDRYKAEVKESGDVSKWPGGYFIAWARTMAKQKYGAEGDVATRVISDSYFEGLIHGYLWRQIAPDFPASELFRPNIPTK
tara:strand:+ start:100 stop:549 length:450 start_codon:yes stop_codon:yes gene_type:complete